MDVGSEHRWAAQLTVSTRLRALCVNLDGFLPVGGDITSLLFANGAVRSLSCLHVAEHIGLGRYGDRLDPLATRRAAVDLCYVLAPGGDPWFSLPVGWPRVAVNAHRFHGPLEMLRLFEGLDLREFVAVDDAGRLRCDVRPHDVAASRSACGLYWFRRS